MTSVSNGNLLENIPCHLPQELVETLTKHNSVRIERIVSHGHHSPDGFWYDQDEHEWVIVLQGHATLRFEEAETTVEMNPGDWVDIPAHCRHRVDATDGKEPTIWLAVFVGS